MIKYVRTPCVYYAPLSRGLTIFTSSNALRLTNDTANAYIAELLGLLASLHALSFIYSYLPSTPLAIEHRLDSDAVVATASSPHRKTSFQWLRTAGQPLWKCFQQLHASFPINIQPSVIWIRGHPERRNTNPATWTIHEYHNHAVDQAANQKASGSTARNLPPTPFTLLHLCPGPTWCTTPPPNSESRPIPILGKLRPTLRSILGLSSLHKYIISRSNRPNTNTQQAIQACQPSFNITPDSLHLPSIRSTWKDLGVKRRVRYTKLFAGWIGTASRQHMWSSGKIPNSCPLCLRHSKPNSTSDNIPVETIYHLLHECPHLHSERSKGIALLTEAIVRMSNNPLNTRQSESVALAYWNNIPQDSRIGIPTIAISQWVAHPISTVLGERTSSTRYLSRLFSSYLKFAWSLWLHRNSLVHEPPAQSTTVYPVTDLQSI